ncbi:helix-turn-helix domain-containing protein [Janthinobacterium sp. LB3P112]|uniref:helix-turn-helix domain-containing protein n=1 Tax=Janthinobacterium sp. LB3P112 TaxID=3424196 RepID=UPI003F26DBEB
MGCLQRTLERQLRESNITAEALRQASRLIRTLHRLSASDSLTMIACDKSFSDLAHMPRRFRRHRECRSVSVVVWCATHVDIQQEHI